MKPEFNFHLPGRWGPLPKNEHEVIKESVRRAAPKANRGHGAFFQKLLRLREPYDTFAAEGGPIMPKDPYRYWRRVYLDMIAREGNSVAANLARYWPVGLGPVCAQALEHWDGDFFITLGRHMKGPPRGSFQADQLRTCLVEGWLPNPPHWPGFCRFTDEATLDYLQAMPGYDFGKVSLGSVRKLRRRDLGLRQAKQKLVRKIPRPR